LLPGSSRTYARLARLAALVWMSMAVAAFADSIRVSRDKATIWCADTPSLVLTVVAAGTVLEVVDRQGVWVRVRLPRSIGDPSVLGLILASNTDAVSPRGKPAPTAAGQQGRGAPQARRAPEPFLLRGFGELGYFQLAAKESFNAIFDKDATWLPGAGADAIWPSGLFASAEVEWFRMRGERVFVLDDQVFRLGIEDVVTVVPISMTLGYHFGRSPMARPFAGAGFGVFIYREHADFAQGSDDLSENFGSLHVLGGVDLVRRRRISTAIEGRYTWVRDSIGEGGVSAGFGETDLGGFTIKVKVLFH
jgi:hypothetical protein